PTPRAILAIDTAPFADSLSLLAAVRALRIHLPQTFVAVAAATGISELLMAARLADETIDLGVIKPHEGGDGLKRLVRLFKRTRGGAGRTGRRSLHRRCRRVAAEDGNQANLAALASACRCRGACQPRRHRCLRGGADGDRGRHTGNRNYRSPERPPSGLRFSSP